ncbi:hypothetical protein B7P43_G16803 [Cryptotermes secundus]|uniref:Gustatory receptor n=1 Tax=Cryptotermes secundus TaxID=105785 RepID=A0A2J7Q5C8_9NEOP|nr:hypothetical protein B7P43_G16803 [Cryptotermes secundus]
MHARHETSDKSGRLFQRHVSVIGEVIETSRLRPAVFTVKSTSDVEPHHRIESNIFYDNLKPFIFVMRAMGVSPVRVTSKGAVVFSWMSLAMLYSACLYLLLCLGVWFTNENRMQAIRNANGRFEDSVDAYMLFVYLVPLVHLPFTHWREASRMATYMNNWVQFQNQYDRVTGEGLTIPLKCQCLTTVLLTVGLSHISILASYFFTATSNNTVPEKLEASTTRATVLADYRILWLELSHLATQTGIAFCYTYGFYLLHHFFMLTLSTYATLSDTLIGTFGNNIPVATCVFISSFMIFTVCEGANGVVLKVS